MLVSKFYGSAYQPVQPKRKPRKPRSKDLPLWHVNAKAGSMFKEKNNLVYGVSITKM